MNFLDALQTKDIVGENGMPTHSTSGNNLVDLFFKQGAFRAQENKTELIKLFQGALVEDKNLAVRCMFYNRDIRGGQGERESFRWMLRFLAIYYPEDCFKIIPLIPFYGRWDDILVLINTPLESEMADFILFALKKGDQLCAKWMPRENKSLGWIAKKLIKIWDLTPREYRHLLSGNTQVVENLMCKNEWGEIIYEHVPGHASLKYKKAFGKHDAERYGLYLTKLEKGEVKAKSDAIFPSDIIHQILNSRYDTEQEIKLWEAQWRDLPNFVPEDLNFIPMSDVSGSMYGQPIEVCLALSLYVSERNKSAFKDAFITFSEKPQLQILKGSLLERMRQLRSSRWGMNTDLEAAFRLILDQAVKNKVSQKDMPKVLIIFSDMQFDQCERKPQKTAFGMIKMMYKNAGYKLPQIVFWNLRDSFGVPVKFDKEGTALVSGYSPSIMKQILNGGMNPLKIALNTLNSERYSKISI